MYMGDWRMGGDGNTDICISSLYLGYKSRLKEIEI
jgi:hypothetical protein